MKKIAFAAAVALLGLGSPAVAQDSDFDSRQIIPNFTKPNLEAIAAQLEPTKTEWRRFGDGEDALAITMQSGAIILVKPAACGTGGCVGLAITALWQKQEGQSDALIHERLAAFNDTAVPSASLYTNGIIALTHYVIADFGIPQGNIVVTLNVFDTYAQRLADIIE